MTGIPTFATPAGFFGLSRADRTGAYTVAGVPLDIVSTGADREHTIIRRHPFD